MKPIKPIIAGATVAFVIAGFVIPSDAHGPGRGMLRHQYFMANGVPEPYRSKRNPLPANAETVKAGIEIFQETCALCHGTDGGGHGEGGKDLDPPPANLMQMMKMPMTTDGYLFWTITQGGEAIGTDMPSYHEVLEEDDMWKVITALRAHLKVPK